jgi:hypothetical protein
MLRKLAILPFLFAVLFVPAAGCTKKDDEVTFKPVPAGTPTVNTGTPTVNTGAPAGKKGAPTPPMAKPVEDR